MLQRSCYKLKNQRKLNYLGIIVLIFFWWHCFNILLGYILAKHLLETHFKKRLKKKILSLLEKYNLDAVLELFIEYIDQYIQDWWSKLNAKTLLSNKALTEFKIICQVFLEKLKKTVTFKNSKISVSLKKLTSIRFKEFWASVQITFSICKECFVEAILFFNIAIWAWNWKNVILKCIKYPTFLIYLLYLGLFGLFGLVMGFLVGLFGAENNDYTYRLFFVLKLLEKMIREYWAWVALEGFSCLIRPTPPRVPPLTPVPLTPIPRPPVLEMFFEKPELPIEFTVPIYGEPYRYIEFSLDWEEQTRYKIELFQFYLDMNDK